MQGSPSSSAPIHFPGTNLQGLPSALGTNVKFFSWHQRPLVIRLPQACWLHPLTWAGLQSHIPGETLSPPSSISGVKHKCFPKPPRTAGCPSTKEPRPKLPVASLHYTHELFPLGYRLLQDRNRFCSLLSPPAVPSTRLGSWQTLLSEGSQAAFIKLLPRSLSISGPTQCPPSRTSPSPQCGTKTAMP